MPDSRHVVVALARRGRRSRAALDGRYGIREYHALTSGTTPAPVPAVSPEGQRIIFLESTGSFDVVSVDLGSAAGPPPDRHRA